MSISSILDNSKKALNAQTAGISVIGDNIANVNTEGYTRRKAELVSTSTNNPANLASGTGVKVNKIIRIADNFINKDLVGRISDRAKSDVSAELLGRAESAFSLEGDPGSINFQLNAFFSALEDLESNPSDIPLRTQVIQRGKDLSLTINSTYESLSRLQREADNRIGSTVSNVNEITSSIAELNQQISKSEVSKQEALSLRDQRDKLLTDLGEIVSFQTIENNNNQVEVYLSNGFSLVNGSKNFNLDVEKSPSFQPAGGFPPGLDGTGLSHIVFDYGGGSHSDLTNLIKSGGGELAGLLKVRGTQSNTDQSAFDADGDIVEVATHIETIARDLLTRFNLEYLGPDEDAGTAGHQPSSFDLDGNSPIPFGLFTFQGAAAGNNFGDVDGDGVPGNNDLNSLIASGDVTNFAGTIGFGVENERAFAAARDLDPADGATAWASGDGSNVTGLLSQRSAVQNYNLGSLNTSTKIDDLYSLSVSSVGNKSSRAQEDARIFQLRESQVREIKDSVSGVNLDEEFAQLINFQRAFQGSARMISLSNELSLELINIL